MALFDYGQFRTDIQNEIPNPIKNPSAQGIESGNVTHVNALYFNIVSFVLLGLGIAAVFILVYAGIQYITAGGDAERAERAKKTILGAIIGIVIIVGAYAIYNYTIRIVG
jgi:hypothetical protein